MASLRACRAMEELTKVNNSIDKLGGDAIAREATPVKAQQKLEIFQESSQKAKEKIVRLQNKEMEYIQKITVLERDMLKMVGDLEIAKGEASSLTTKLKEVAETAKRDVEMVVR